MVKKAQLPTSTKEYKRYIESDLWGVQQKCDGVRWIIDVDNKLAFNRNGIERDTPFDLSHLGEYKGWVVDGEFVDKTYYIFDGYKGLENRRVPFIERWQELRALCGDHGEIVVIDLWTELMDKLEFFHEVKNAGGEGVVFKNLQAGYSGGRNFNSFKYKFTKDVDCVVIALGEDKANLHLGMYDNGVLVEVGKSSSLTGDGPKCKVGDVVKINCLYVGVNGRLYQPVLPRLRTDKLPRECTIDQLDGLGTNKKVL